MRYLPVAVLLFALGCIPTPRHTKPPFPGSCGCDAYYCMCQWNRPNGKCDCDGTIDRMCCYSCKCRHRKKGIGCPPPSRPCPHCK